MTKTQCICQLARRCGGMRYNNTGIGVWYTKLAFVVGGRMPVWFWRVATGRSFCSLTMHDGLSHTVSICGIAFWGAFRFPLSFLSCLFCTRYCSTIRAPSVIWGAVGGMYHKCVVSLVESVQFSYRSNENNLTHLHA